MASDYNIVMNRELNPWICDILGNTGITASASAATATATAGAGSSSSSSSSMKIAQQRKLRRKAWMSLGTWLSYVVGIDPDTV